MERNELYDITELRNRVAQLIPSNYVIDKNDNVCEIVINRMTMEMEKTLPVFNFLPVVLDVFLKKQLGDGKEMVYLKVGAIQRGALIGAKEFAQDEIKNIDFQLDISFTLFVEEERRYRKILLELIRRQLSSMQSRTVYMIDRLGYFQVNGKRGYVAGNRIIGDGLPQIEISNELKAYRLFPEEFEEPDECEVIKYVSDLLSLNRLAPVLFTATLLGLLRKPLAEGGLPVKFSMYVRGNQSSGKTTAVSHCCSYYDRDDDIEAHLHNFTASEAKLHKILDAECDMSTIIDDFRSSENKAVLREQEIRLDNLIRVAGNNKGKENVNSNNDVNCFLVFTGEYFLRNPSSCNRVVMLDLDESMMKGENLLKISRNPILLSCFLERFIEWILHRYDKILELVRRYKFVKQQKSLEGEIYQSRLNSHKFVLNVTYQIFLNFCRECGWEVGFSAKEYDELIADVIRHQIQVLNLDGKKTKDDIIVEFYQYYKTYQLIWECRPRADYPDYIFRKNGLIYIRGVILRDLFSDKSPGEVNRLIRELDWNGLLKTSDSVSKTVKNVRPGNHWRYYCIFEERLDGYVKEIIGFDDEE